MKNRLETAFSVKKIVARDFQRVYCVCMEDTTCVGHQ